MYDVEEIKTSLLKQNTWNANVLSKEMFKKLKNNIKKEGIRYPILVNKVDKNDYVVIDGAHRLKASLELKNKTVPCIIFEKLSDTDCMKMNLEVNRIKGEDDLNKLSDLLSELFQDDKYEVNELIEELPYSKDFYENVFDYDKLDEFGILSENHEDEDIQDIEEDIINSYEEKEKIITVKFKLTESVYDSCWIPVIQHFGSDTPQEEIFEELCRSFVES